jgi:hypothetical protein
MVDLEVVARIGARVDALGGVWMGQPVMAVGAALGLGGYPWPFYMIGRGGVLGDVDADRVAAAMVFPSPGLVRSAWREGRALMTPQEGAVRFIGCAYDWAPNAIGGAPGLERATELMMELIPGLDYSESPLADGWRQMSIPAGLAEQAVWAINVLREHRGGVHAACVLAGGLPPVVAVMATEGESMAQMYGWEGPYPPAEECKPRKEPVERATNEKVGESYRALDEAQLSELADLLEATQSA